MTTKHIEKSAKKTVPINKVREEPSQPVEASTMDTRTGKDENPLNTLLKQVQNEAGSKSSIDVLLRGIAAQISSYKDDPGRLQNLSDQLLSMSTSFADAVVRAA